MQGQLRYSPPSSSDRRIRYFGCIRRVAEPARAVAPGQQRPCSGDPSYTLRFLDAVFKVFDEESRQGLNHLQYVSEISASMFAYKERLESQKRAAPDDEEWDEKINAMSSRGFTIDRFEPSVINGYHFGQLICVTRQA